MFESLKFYCTQERSQPWCACPANILHKSIAGRYRPVSYPDGPITARCRFIKNASWVLPMARKKKRWGTMDCMKSQILSSGGKYNQFVVCWISPGSGKGKTPSQTDFHTVAVRKNIASYFTPSSNMISEFQMSTLAFRKKEFKCFKWLKNCTIDNDACFTFT